MASLSHMGLISLCSVLSCVLITLTCLLGDFLLSWSSIHHYMVLGAITDSLTHGLVALWVWLGQAHSTDGVWLEEAALCFVLACLVDVDHFLLARSLHLKDALSLDHRPFLHNTTLCLIIVFIIFLVRRPLYQTLPIHLVWHLPWIVLASFTSHHLRDATRRGVWLSPWGSTRPLSPQYVYIICVNVLVFIIRFIMTLDRMDNKTAEAVSLV